MWRQGVLHAQLQSLTHGLALLAPLLQAHVMHRSVRTAAPDEGWKEDSHHFSAWEC